MLLASYGLVSVVSITIGLILARQLILTHKRLADITLVPLTAIMFALFAGMSEFGHYSAVVAAGFLLLAMSLGMASNDVGRSARLSTWIFLLAALFAVGQTWVALFQYSRSCCFPLL